MADPDNLHTGVQPPPEVFGNEQLSDEVQAEIEAQREKLKKLVSVADLVITYCEEEREAISDIRSYLSRNIKKTKEIEIEFRARELYLDFLDRLQNTVTDQIEAMKAENGRDSKDK